VLSFGTLGTGTSLISSFSQFLVVIFWEFFPIYSRILVFSTLVGDIFGVFFVGEGCMGIYSSVLVAIGVVDFCKNCTDLINSSINLFTGCVDRIYCAVIL
jgi:hypothetical protein